MRRRKLLVALVGLAVLAAAALMVSPLPPLAATAESFDRIQVAGWNHQNSDGMCRADVEAILGPPGDYRTGPTLNHALDTFTGVTRVGPLTVLAWKGDTEILLVYFDSTGQAIEKLRTIEVPAEQEPLDALVWRAQRRWHRWFPE